MKVRVILPYVAESAEPQAEQAGQVVRIVDLPGRAPSQLLWIAARTIPSTKRTKKHRRNRVGRWCWS